MITPLDSLRGRFLVAILIWVVIGISAIWLSSERLFSAHVEEQYHDELEVHVRELAGLTRLAPNGDPVLIRPLSDPRYAVPLSGFYWQITRPDHRPLRSESMTRGALDDRIAHSREILHRIEAGPTGPTITYGMIRPMPDGRDLHFAIATDSRLLDETISSFTRELTVWLALLAVALLASGMAIIIFGLRPLASLAQSIARLRSGEMARLDGQFPAEIRSTVAELNGYVERNSAIIDRARVNAGNLAHSLRTPLAVITDEAERLQIDDDRADRASVFLDQAARMQRQIDYHLARTRSGGSQAGRGAHCRLQDMVPSLLGAMRRLHPDIRFPLPNDLDRAPLIACDGEDLREILSNLIDNAGKWARAEVVVGWQQEQGHFAITVADDGPGMAPDEIGRAFAIGAVLDPVRGGTGLGLAISRDIARDYGGDVVLSSGAAGGLVARIIFPA